MIEVDQKYTAWNELFYMIILNEKVTCDYNHEKGRKDNIHICCSSQIVVRNTGMNIGRKKIKRIQFEIPVITTPTVLWVLQ